MNLRGLTLPIWKFQMLKDHPRTCINKTEHPKGAMTRIKNKPKSLVLTSTLRKCYTFCEELETLEENIPLLLHGFHPNPEGLRPGDPSDPIPQVAPLFWNPDWSSRHRLWRRTTPLLGDAFMPWMCPSCPCVAALRHAESPPVANAMIAVPSKTALIVLAKDQFLSS